MFRRFQENDPSQNVSPILLITATEESIASKCFKKIYIEA